MEDTTAASLMAEVVKLTQEYYRDLHQKVKDSMKETDNLLKRPAVYPS